MIPPASLTSQPLTIGSLLSVGALCEGRVHLVEGESSPENSRDHGPRCPGFSRAAPPELGEIPLADDDMQAVDVSTGAQRSGE